MPKSKKAKRKPKSEVKIGLFSLGTQQVELWIVEESGGSFAIWPDRGKSICKMRIGHAVYWWNLLNRVLHEAFELVFCQMYLRLRPHPEFCDSSGSYVFHATHQQFEEAVARVAAFLDDALPSIKKEWNNRKRSK